MTDPYAACRNAIRVVEPFVPCLRAIASNGHIGMDDMIVAMCRWNVPEIDSKYNHPAFRAYLLAVVYGAM